jgi:hypothetical protein
VIFIDAYISAGMAVFFFIVACMLTVRAVFDSTKAYCESTDFDRCVDGIRSAILNSALALGFIGLALVFAFGALSTKGMV